MKINYSLQITIMITGLVRKYYLKEEKKEKKTIVIVTDIVKFRDRFF